MASAHIDSKRKRVARVIVTFNDVTGLTQKSCGTGFFISEDGTFLTCFHVAFVQDMERVQQDARYASHQGTEQEKYIAYHKAVVVQIVAVLSDDSQVEMILDRFDAHHDIAVLKTKQGGISSERVFKINIEAHPDYGDHMNFVGFPQSIGIEVDKSPFAYSTGYVSAFPDCKIAGSGKYEHIQMNAINLGGNSGGPLFIDESEEVIGIVNGNMTWGHDRFAIFNAKTNLYEKGAYYVPLGIAYATSLKLLKEKGVL
jgi:S1-C subfamily serine protease